MIKKLTLIALSLMATFAGMAQDGKLSRYRVKVGDFRVLRVVNDINVDYVCNPDSAGLVVFYSTPDKVNAFMFDNNGKGKLSIQLSTDEALAPKGLPTLRVYSQFLQEAQNDGDSLLQIVKVAPAPKLKFKVVGNGSLRASGLSATTVEAVLNTGRGIVEVSGKCTEAVLKVTGSGDVVADNLASENVKCTILGTGNISCNVNGGPLSIKGSGSGKVHYRGTPSEIKSLQIGSIKAMPLN